ncbi:nucleolar protein 11 [Chelonus insularis]|uniref:nucleolar protein 11 n=1 Tax=Chelonus insularis TaxID=460826 RepID=UPI00158DCC08|nr:nucleolar protein 11 [Chelonus insularis]
MAKLCSYYTLCPLIDQQSLLGVEKDQNPGCAIVTLGRNIVIRYKLQDLKQVNSWSTKTRLTSQVVYDRETERYVAIFNEKYIRTWSDEEVDLDKVKGHKFHSAFNSIILLNNHSPVLVRQDGSTASLKWALANRKTWLDSKVLQNDEKIQDCKLIQVNNRTYLCALTKIGAMYNYVIVNLHEETFVENLDHISRIELKRTSEQLVGHVVLCEKNNAYLLTLWSHGRLYSYPLISSCSDPPPGILVSVLSSISTNHPVIMTALNETTVAMYGADANEEGAILMIYNIQFKIAQATQKLKLYTKDAKLWQIDDKLLLAANRHLAVVPYRLAYQRIEAMLGSLKSNREEIAKNEDNDVVEIQESVVANWQDFSLPNRLSFTNIPPKIAKQINALVHEGESDAAIYQAVIPQLIESKNISSILWCIKNLKDLPEKMLVDLLIFGLKSLDDTFVPVQNGTDNSHKVAKYTTKNQFLDQIFCLSFTDFSVLTHLKSALTFNDVLWLIKYLSDKLQSTEISKCDTEPSDKQLYEWIGLLFDSHYQYYLLSKDPEVYVLLDKLKNILDDHFQTLKDIEDLRPMIQRFMSGKPLKPTRTNCTKFYSIEEVKLY